MGGTDFLWVPFAAYVVAFFLLALLVVITMKIRSPAWRFAKEHKQRQALASALADASREILRCLADMARLDQAGALLAGFGSAQAFLHWFREKDAPFWCDELLLSKERRSKMPLVKWMDQWLDSSDLVKALEDTTARSWRLKSGNPGWDAEDAFKVACKLQLEQWAEQRKEPLVKARALQMRINSLASQLGLDPVQHLQGADALPEAEIEAKRDDKHERLKQLRVRVAEFRDEERKLEQEILEEDTKAAPGPHRKAAGVSTDDD